MWIQEWRVINVYLHANTPSKNINYNLFVTLKHLVFVHPRYQVEELGFQTRKDLYGIVLIVDQKIDVTVTQMTIGPFSLLARFGGIIGVGQTLAWVAHFCIDFLHSSHSNIRFIYGYG